MLAIRAMVLKTASTQTAVRAMSSETAIALTVATRAMVLKTASTAVATTTAVPVDTCLTCRDSTCRDCLTDSALLVAMLVTVVRAMKFDPVMVSAADKPDAS